MFPPSDYEKARNNAIYGGVSVGPLTYAQGNRNPFIDVPQFADAILIPSGMTSFGKWQTENFSLAQLFDDAVSGRNADADGDGRDTYAEFLLNTDPLSGADTPLVFTRNGNQVTLVFHRPIAEIPEQADIQSCTTLEQEDWDDVPNWKTTSVITQVGDYERIEFTTMLAAPEIETRRFWRVAFD
jgi:hypothetical protein